MDSQTALNTEATETENKQPDTTGFNTTPEFNKLTKTPFDWRMKKSSKTTCKENQVDNALDIADKNREDMKRLQAFDLSYFNDRRYFHTFTLMDCKTTWYFNQFIIVLQSQLRILKA